MPAFPRAAAALIALACLAGCGAPGEETSCGEPGATYSQILLIDPADSEDWEQSVVFLVCTEERTIAIVDENGDDYTSLEDFQRNNELFDLGDEMTVPGDFPAIDSDADFETVPAKTLFLPVWQIVGLGVLALALIGLIVFLVSWRSRSSPTGIGDAFKEELSQGRHPPPGRRPWNPRGRKHPLPAPLRSTRKRLPHELPELDGQVFYRLVIRAEVLRVVLGVLRGVPARNGEAQIAVGGDALVLRAGDHADPLLAGPVLPAVQDLVVGAPAVAGIPWPVHAVIVDIDLDRQFLSAGTGLDGLPSPSAVIGVV